MGVNISLARSVASTLAASMVLLVIGCSDDSGLQKRYKVSGKVTYKGAPVEKGTISFLPEKSDGHGANGQIENGYYTLTTLSEGDGAFPGKYKVILDTRQIDEAAAKEATRKFAESRKIEGLVQIPQEVQAKLLAEAKSSIPEKYTSSDKTPLTVEVKEQSNTIDFDLTD